MKKFTTVLPLLALLMTMSFETNAQQWIAQPSNVNPNNYVQFIDAVDTNVVWGLASDRNSQLNPVQEFTRTTNGGNTWTPGVITNAANHGPSCIMALNADTAWVAMFNTSGGGGKVLRTNDGGLTWTHQSTATFSAPAGFPNVVHFFDANDGICMGDPNGGYFEIYTTTDGGNDWIRVPQANIPANQTAEYGITDVYTTYGDSTLYFGTNQGRIYKSSDRGNNWTVSSTPYTGYLGAIAFRDANFGLACEADNATTSTDLIYTNDGGTTWNLLPTQAGGFTLKQSIRFVPGTDSTFVITSPYTIYGSAFSVDNGNNWKVMDNLIHSDCDFVNATTGWSGGGEIGSPIYKWTGPLTIASNDVAMKSIDVRKATGISQQIPKATVLNNGLTTQTFNVTMEISGGYTSTKSVSALTYNQSQQVNFDPWTPGATGTYTITVYTQLSTDSDLSNDTLYSVTNTYNELPNYGWVSKQPLTVPTFGLATGYVRVPALPADTGYFFATGGSDLINLQTKHERFDVQTGNWMSYAPIPLGIYQFSMQNVKNTLYASGGYTGGFSPSLNNFAYHYQTDTWNTITAMPQPVGDYASGVYADSLIYYIGGYNGSSDLNSVQIYNPSNDSWLNGTPKPGTASAGLRGAIFNNMILVTGGYSQSSQSPLDEAWLGTIDANDATVITWQALPPYPGGTITRFAAGSVYADALPYIIFTGGDPTGQGIEVSDDVWAYDLVNNQWLIGPPKPTACSNISNFTSVIYNDSIYMAIASGYKGNNTLSNSNEWLNLGPSPFVAVKEISAAPSQLMVFPNPAYDKFTLDLPEEMDRVRITVYNAQGSIVLNKLVYRNESVSVTGLASGIYQVKAESNSLTLTSRLAIIR